MSKLIDGQKLAANIQAELKKHIAEKTKEHGRQPGLWVLTIGDEPASLSFVKIKQRVASDLGIYFEQLHLPETSTLAQIIDVMQEKNADPCIDGVLLQLPVPERYDELKLCRTIHPYKDVDVLHPKNIGLWYSAQAGLMPPVAKALDWVLGSRKIKLSRTRVMLVGTGRLIGLPLAAFLIHQKATLTWCHDQTKDLKEHARSAELLISGTGQPDLITAQMVNPQMVVIDYGFAIKNGKVVGDVDFSRVKDGVRAITPVPGGMGPLTVTALMENVFTLYLKNQSQPDHAN